MARSRMVLLRTTVPCAVQTVPDSTATTGKNEFAIPMSLDRVAKMARVPSNTESTAEFNNTASQSKSDSQRNIRDNTFSLPNRNDSEPAEYAIDLNVKHHVAGNRTEYKAQCQGYSAEYVAYKFAVGLPTNFMQC